MRKITALSGSNIWKTRLNRESSFESEEMIMKYYSTRDKSLRYDAAEAVKMGLSRDGGLLTPTEIPQIDEAFLNSLVHAWYQ